VLRQLRASPSSLQECLCAQPQQQRSAWTVVDIFVPTFVPVRPSGTTSLWLCVLCSSAHSGHQRLKALCLRLMKEEEKANRERCLCKYTQSKKKTINDKEKQISRS
jgi:hypothetical protein